MGLFFRPRRPLARLAAEAAGANVVHRADRFHLEHDPSGTGATSADQATGHAVARLLAPPPAGERRR